MHWLPFYIELRLAMHGTNARITTEREKWGYRFSVWEIRGPEKVYCQVRLTDDVLRRGRILSQMALKVRRRWDTYGY